MKTLNGIAVALFLFVFLLQMLPSEWWSWPRAALSALAFTVPLYLMGLVLRWFVRGLVK